MAKKHCLMHPLAKEICESYQNSKAWQWKKSQNDYEKDAAWASTGKKQQQRFKKQITCILTKIREPCLYIDISICQVQSWPNPRNMVQNSKCTNKNQRYSPYGH